MGDDTRDISDPRGSGRATAPYSEEELQRLGVLRASAGVCDQVGLAFAKVDGRDLHLSRLAEFFLKGESDTFAESGIVAKAVRTTDPDAQWDYVCVSGRVLRIRRASWDGGVWLFFHDITLESDTRAVMDGSAGMGMGFFQYSVDKKRLLVFGDFLDNMLSRREQVELRRSNFESLMHPRSRAKFKSALDNVISKGEPVETAFECSCQKRPSFHLQMQMTPIFAITGEVVKIVGGIRDITVERQAHSELMRLRNENAANVEARRFMVARIAHEVRTPLTGIAGMARFMAQTAGTHPGMAEQLAILQRAAEDAIRQIDSLSAKTASTRPEDKYAPEPVRIRDLLTETAGLWAAKAHQKGVRLGVKVADNVPPEALVDPVRLRQCLNNTLSNAVEHTREGSIRIGCGVTGDIGGQRLVIAIRDTGEGMDTETRANLFQSSRGMGMSITRGLIVKMGGGILVESEKDVGTTVTITLPMRQAAELSTPTNELVNALIKETPAAPRPYEGLRVLVVDDNATNIEVVEQLLRTENCNVVRAFDGQQAIEQLKSTPVDIVLMDIHMPVMDGIEATLAIRSSKESYSDVPIVALTADADYQQKRVALNLGMDTAMPKPVRLSRLLEVFEELGLGERKKAA